MHDACPCGKPPVSGPSNLSEDVMAVTLLIPLLASSIDMVMVMILMVCDAGAMHVRAGSRFQPLEVCTYDLLKADQARVTMESERTCGKLAR